MTEHRVSPLTTAVGANIRRRRLGLNLTLDQVSGVLERLGHPVTTPALSRLERGERRIDLEDLTTLAKVLGVDVVELLEVPTAVPGREVKKRAGQVVAAWQVAAERAREQARATNATSDAVAAFQAAVRGLADWAGDRGIDVRATVVDELLAGGVPASAVADVAGDLLAGLTVYEGRSDLN